MQLHTENRNYTCRELDMEKARDPAEPQSPQKQKRATDRVCVVVPGTDIYICGKYLHSQIKEPNWHPCLFSMYEHLLPVMVPVCSFNRL